MVQCNLKVDKQSCKVVNEANRKLGYDKERVQKQVQRDNASTVEVHG